MTNIARGAVAIALLYSARRFYRNWGTTKEECQMQIPGDRLIRQPADVTTEGIWIDAPPSAVWPWLVQMGWDRAGFYAFPGLENADRIYPEWQQLTAGDTVRIAPKSWSGRRDRFVLSVVEVLDQQAIVLRTPDGSYWDAVCTFHLAPHWQHQCRLLVRTRIRLAHPGAIMITELVGAPRALAVRQILKSIKRRAENTYQAELSDAAAVYPAP